MGGGRVRRTSQLRMSGYPGGCVEGDGLGATPHTFPNTLGWTKDVQVKQRQHPCRAGGWGGRAQDLGTGRGLSKRDVKYRKDTDYIKNQLLPGQKLTSQTHENLGGYTGNTYDKASICLN